MVNDILICDLDGTLVDSVADLATATNRLLQEEGFQPLSNEAVRGMVGRGVPTLVARAFAARDRPVEEAELRGLTRRFLDFYEGAEAVHTHPYPEVPETLEHLCGQGWRIAVCTNKPQASTQTILDTLDLSRFVAAACGGDRTPALKPDAAHIRATLDMLEPRGGKAVMVGDSRSDALAAKAAGIPAILVRYGYAEAPVETLGADLVIESFGQLRELLPRLVR